MKKERILTLGRKTKVTIRDRINGYKTIRRTVYFKNGKGTYIIYNGREIGVSFTQFNNTAHTLEVRRFD